MLFLAPGTSNLRRAQGTYISDEEITAVIDFFSDQPPQYSAEIAEATAAAAKKDKDKDGPPADTSRHQDPVYQRACEVVIGEGRGSVSLLQRSLGIGYGRAARMIDWMAEDGVVGEYNGAKCREVICTLDDWHDRQNGLGRGSRDDDDYDD